MKNNLTLASGLWIDYTVVNGLGLTPQEKMLFSMIWELSKRSEGCTASNQYFMAHLEMPSEQSVSEALKRLKDKKLINIRTVKIQGGSKRYITTAIKIHTPQKSSSQSTKTGVHSPQKPSKQSINYGADNIEDKIYSDIIEDLDASASSAAPEKMGIRNNYGGSFPPSLYCVKCGYSEPFKGEHKICPKCSDNKIKFQMLAVSETPKKEDKIPYKEISDYFLKKHREFRKVKDEKYMPKWGAKETKAVKRIIDTMQEASFNQSKYKELSADKIMRSFQFTVEAFLLYLKDCKDSNYAKTTPILPSQLTEKVFNRILPYIQKLETAPKLEIKQYENKGIAIGPMPEGW